MEIITVFDGVCPLTKLENIKPLQLPWQWETELNYLIATFPNTDIWLKSSNSYEEFQNDLKSQGYSNIPSSSEPRIWLAHVDTDLNEKEGLIRKGKKPVVLHPDVLTRLHHKHKMSKYQSANNSPVA